MTTSLAPAITKLNSSFSDKQRTEAKRGKSFGFNRYETVNVSIRIQMDDFLTEIYEKILARA